MTTRSATPPRVSIERAPPQERRRLGFLALFAAIYTYALVVFGGIVRITGSGMGCGDDWPRCNGQWIPDFSLETLIEYTHRLLAAGIGIVVLAVFAYALLHRRKPGFSGPGGVLRPLAAAALLLVLQIALGAITVRLELPTEVTVAHFVTAMLFMATLILTAVRGGVFGEGGADTADPRGARGAARMAIAAAVLTLVLVSLGAVTANTAGAPQACQGFPLCNGTLLPRASAAGVHIHWTHRIVAYLLTLHVLGATFAAHRRGGSRAVTRAATTATALVLAQIGIAAALVLSFLPRSLQALHLAVGAAIWFTVVVWLALARRDARSALGSARNA